MKFSIVRMAYKGRGKCYQNEQMDPAHAEPETSATCAPTLPPRKGYRIMQYAVHFTKLLAHDFTAVPRLTATCHIYTLELVRSCEWGYSHEA